MTIEKVNVKFRGIYPTKDELMLIDSTIDEIERDAPDGSQIKVICTKNNLFYKIVLTLNSSAKLFIAVSRSQLLGDAIAKTLKQTRKKIDRIKTPRFHRHQRYSDTINSIQ